MENCIICLEETNYKLSCNHYYHINCIKKWFENTKKFNCCLCKKLIIEKEIIYSQIDINKEFIKACKNDDIKLVYQLLEHGADVNTNDDAALRESAFNDHIEIVKVLLEKGANIHVWDDHILRFSAYYGHLEIVKVLLEYGENIHVRDDYIIKLAEKNEELKKVIQSYFYFIIL